MSGVQVVRLESWQQEIDIRKEEEKWRYEQTFPIEGGGTATAVVMPPTGAKCPRCWRHKALKVEEAAPTTTPAEVKLEEEGEVVESKKEAVHAPLCSRCVVAVEEQKASGKELAHRGEVRLG